MTVKVTFAGCGDSVGSGGRFNTCFLVEAPDICFAIDFGASSLVALNALKFPHNRIDAILCTHIHGDHCGGIPFLLIDAMLGARRATPLTLAGPKGFEAGLTALRDALFPGMHVMAPKFDLETIEMETLTPHDIRGLKVTTYPAVHVPETNPTSMRIEIGDKVIAYTGDSEWTEHMPELARHADLLIAECYFHEKSVRNHLNYPDIAAHQAELSAKRIVLTHMSPEMLAHVDDVPELCAHDGLVVEL